MANLIKPQGYKPILDITQTELGIKKIKEFFQQNLSAQLRLRRVTAPLFVLKGMGINDDLNGIERPVQFPIKDLNEQKAEVVHSLAKWKRMMLADYSIESGFGLFTDMNAIRPDEELDNLHSLYVDQWDWEKHIEPQNRNIDYLYKTVRDIYQVLKNVEYIVYEAYPQIKPQLPEDIFFITSQELLDMYPTLSPKERENEIVKKHKAVFICGIGAKLSNGEKHDGRAADYDDWSSENSLGYKGLNGDIMVWNDVLGCAFELSSMGIRVDKQALIRQLEIENQNERKELYFHKRLLEGSLVESIGGGIGQSRLCMFLLRKAHIGEIQSSIWSDEMRQECKKANITLI